MEENPSGLVHRRDTTGSHQESSSRSTGKHHHHHRYPVEDDDDEDRDQIECSGKNCRSCIAGVIADCVAVCCCPCAVVNILTFAFLKVPWTVGRRCLGLGKKKRCRGLENKKRKCDEGESEVCYGRGGDGILGNCGGEDGASEIGFPGFGISGEEEWQKDNNYSARFEAEKVWLELYQVGHLGFGRVSFTGIPSLGKGS